MGATNTINKQENKKKLYQLYHIKCSENSNWKNIVLNTLLGQAALSVMVSKSPLSWCETKNAMEEAVMCRCDGANPGKEIAESEALRPRDLFAFQDQRMSMTGF